MSEKCDVKDLVDSVPGMTRFDINALIKMGVLKEGEQKTVEEMTKLFNKYNGGG